MSIIKEYNEKSTFCKVTFKLPKGIINSTSNICLAGEFNNWNIKNLPMKKLKSGEFATSLNLERGKEYQFKYIVDGKEWINDKDADWFVTNQFTSENSIIAI